MSKTAGEVKEAAKEMTDKADSAMADKATAMKEAGDQWGLETLLAAVQILDQAVYQVLQ